MTKHNLSEPERIIELDNKINAMENANKDVSFEIKNLKKVSQNNGKELVGLENNEQYPAKIKMIMEE